MSRKDDILGFWFGAAATTADEMRAKMMRWYRGGETVDAAIRDQFAIDVEHALAGQLDTWAADPHGRVALVLLLDQFTRNLFRDTAKAFAGDPQARRLAIEAFDHGVDASLSLDERMFLVMPLIHAEDLALQERAIGLMDRVVADAPVDLRSTYAMGMESSRQHRDTIARFGRFPARNAALGRESTPDEIAFLAPKA
jgi:uncharacterized protein (DUF924 family)